MVPLIFETNSSDNYDRILLIDCDVETQIKRSSLRDNQSNKDIQRIISSQATRDERLSIADDVVLNTSSFEYLRNEIFKIHKKYMEIINNA
jgi:dephospho-CoA kinase